MIHIRAYRAFYSKISWIQRKWWIFLRNYDTCYPLTPTNKTKNKDKFFLLQNKKIDFSLYHYNAVFLAKIRAISAKRKSFQKSYIFFDNYEFSRIRSNNNGINLPIFFNDKKLKISFSEFPNYKFLHDTKCKSMAFVYRVGINNSWLIFNGHSFLSSKDVYFDVPNALTSSTTAVGNGRDMQENNVAYLYVYTVQHTHTS